MWARAVEVTFSYLSVEEIYSVIITLSLGPPPPAPLSVMAKVADTVIVITGLEDSGRYTCRTFCSQRVSFTPTSCVITCRHKLKAYNLLAVRYRPNATSGGRSHRCGHWSCDYELVQ